jgi:hypothetical protein
MPLKEYVLVARIVLQVHVCTTANRWLLLPHLQQQCSTMQAPLQRLSEHDSNPFKDSQ